jgi:DNA-binding HxlR family transcriptional regulator
VKRTDRRSDCPTNFAVELLGDSWSLLIIRDLMFKGKRTYSEFAASEEQISTSILAARLRSLIRAGLVRRTGSGRATRYALTRKGADLLGVMVEMILWSAKHDPETAAPDDFVARARSDRDGLLSELEAQMSAAHSLSPVG